MRRQPRVVEISDPKREEYGHQFREARSRHDTVAAWIAGGRIGPEPFVPGHQIFKHPEHYGAKLILFATNTW